MAGRLDICNQALSIIGTRSVIASLSEASEEAQQCLLHYDSCLTGLLRIAPWSFAKKQTILALILAASGTDENLTGIPPYPPEPWIYEYAWPQDCLRVRSIYGVKPIPYAIGVDSDYAGNQFKVILTNEQQAQLIYTAMIDDPNLWDSEFSDAMVYTLAARLCGPLTGDKGLTQTYSQMAKDAILQARVTDAVENPVSPEHIPDWILVREFIQESDPYYDRPLR